MFLRGVFSKISCLAKLFNNKEDKFIEKAVKRFQNGLDVVSIVRTQDRVKAIEKVLYNQS
jgi:hypothetical protein